MSEPLTLGVAGLGTVGAGLIHLLDAHAARLAETIGRPIKVAGVSARTRAKERGLKLDGVTWFDDPVKLATDPSISVFVELIGGEDGAAKAAVEAALNAKKHVVTANKALLAKHGIALANLAEKNGVALNFEAAVAGGIPVIKTLREGLAANSVQARLRHLERHLQLHPDQDAGWRRHVRRGAQGGAGQGLCRGRSDVRHRRLRCRAQARAADEPRIRHHRRLRPDPRRRASRRSAPPTSRPRTAWASASSCSASRSRRHPASRRASDPAMVPKHSAIAEVSGVTNCVAIDGDFVGSLLLVGSGAGAGPTASAVASDILDIARGLVLPPFLKPTATLKPYKRAKLGAHQGAYYVRLSVYDKPGAMATIAKRMGDQDVSLESIVQRRPRSALPGIDARAVPGTAAPVILITHETTEEAIRLRARGH